MLNDSKEEIKLKDTVDEELEDLEVNIQGTEAVIPPAPVEEFIEPVDDVEEAEEDLDINFEEIEIEDFESELELEDFNDEH